MGQRTTFPWLFKAKDGQRLKAPVGVNSTGVRFNHLPRQIQPETAVVAGPFHHLMSQVTQAQLTVHAPEGVIVQPVGAALFTFPIGNHHLTGTGVTFPLNPLAQIPLPPGPNVGMVITIR